MRIKPENFNVRKFDFEVGEYGEKEVIWIDFPYSLNLKRHLQNYTKARWSPQYQKWHVPDNTRYRRLFKLPKKVYSKKLIKKIHPVNKPAFLRYVDELQLKGYSKSTIRTYSSEFGQLLKTINSYPVEEMNAEKLRSYFLYCIKTKKLSESVIHSRLNAVKFYFGHILHCEKLFLEIPRPKKPSTLPKVLSTNDIKKMFKTLNNLKHLLLMKMCYGMGLRVSELVNIKITDIDSDRMQVLIRSSKGKKDRYVVLPDSVLTDLRNYYLAYRPVDFLFEGQYGGKYSVRSVQQVFKTAMRKAKINKKVGVHSLRHSYATHLIEMGTDIRFVQELLGHKSLKTTMTYTHLTDQSKRKIKSPLDKLNDL